jgi:hypothetical protein
LRAVLVPRNTRVRRNPVAYLLALVAALITLAAVPALAAAAPFTVDGAGDAPKSVAGPICMTAEGTCTLRAAIQATNAEPDPDTIGFSSSVFDGTVEIEPASQLPVIEEPVTISGDSISHGTYKGPSVGVITPTGARGLRVQADDVTVEDLAIGGGISGIEVLEGSEGFTATGDWFGLQANGNAVPIQGMGLVLRDGADGAIIGAGEHEAETRNVFTNSQVGIEVYGASKTKILGNYIGVGPDGSGPATVGIGVDVHNGPAAKAEETEIGGILSATEAGTPVCDGACNVITTDGSTAIVIYGEATGKRSVVRGNFVGLEADGVTPVGESIYDVEVSSGATCGDGPEVTIGGTSPTEANYIVGGHVGIYAEGAENFIAAGNAIGIDAEGEPSTSPEAIGIGLCAEGVTSTAHLTGNRMALADGVLGIDSSYGHADIVGNSIEGGIAGIVTTEDNGGAGDLIQGNTITDIERQGIELVNDSNVVIGNTITRAEWSGIALDGHTTGNRVGGDAPGEANTIVESGLRGEEEDGAITMFTRRGLRNEFAANTGSGNHGAFLKLFANPIEGEIANGIAPPTVAVARQSSASGTTAPEATVRVYAKASAEPGELGAQLAVVKADAAGNWSATYAKQAVGGLITATATKEGGTSELATLVAAALDPEEEKGGGGGGDNGGGGNSGGGSTNSASGGGTTGPPPPAAIAKVAPKLKITASPKKTTTATIATFKFKATNVSGAKFECRLDGAKWAKCKSPKTYKKLKPGRHAFRVRATASGLTGAIVKYQFTVKD